jgi:thioredoxin-like negative regulator of GroEL
MSELDSDVPFEVLEDTFGEVIDEATAADAVAELERLKKVSAKKEWIEQGRYRDAEEALRKNKRSNEETNDHACALAWLALTSSRLDYWDKAIAELETLKKRSDKEAKKRVVFNLERIRAARKAAGA